MAHDVEKALRHAVFFKYFALVLSGVLTGAFIGSIADDVASIFDYDLGYHDTMSPMLSATCGVGGVVAFLLAVAGHSATVTHGNYLRKYGNT